MQQKRGLPAPTTAFCDKKAGILHQLALPDAEYSDASPKGSVDAGIRHLIDEVNCAEGFVTTSSCAGRVSVFLEGRRTKKTTPDDDERQREQRAGVGGKGAGGTWLYVSHEPVPRGGQDGRACWLDVLGFSESAVGQGGSHVGAERRLIHFKFEPMILHVLAASTAHAQALLRAGLQAGFRESGAVSLTPPNDTQPATPMVAIRSLGLGFESLIGYETPGGQRCWLVSADLLETLRAVADERFSENTRRIERFRAAFLDAVRAPESMAGREWEDAATRRERKRAEGLRRKAALAAEKTGECAPSDGPAVESVTMPDPT
ncbi:methyltransferase TYW3 domain-containing protein [Hirsutella rhossiliensis]|uniref:tRNA(Phe) 7-[(3-amino-3-carboxypropyl)-4-demethylwyosine(37)-N(4)]-methyltransferase n=1 Tax=Hirsutella rhossiliensis TaxID=111463 RepID=A0A9P8SIH7_9HYPO|nr:methyltransferase TYW3 domain-containing protein [Hirsutella rhossiliensis]KAH0963901.1 methyltransferase TYW3 domain-containing protein [Hirsutella rhossiliensis]